MKHYIEFHLLWMFALATGVCYDMKCHGVMYSFMFLTLFAVVTVLLKYLNGKYTNVDT